MSLTGSGLRDAGGWQRVGKKALLVEEQDAGALLCTNQRVWLQLSLLTTYVMIVERLLSFS